MEKCTLLTNEERTLCHALEFNVQMQGVRARSALGGRSPPIEEGGALRADVVQCVHGTLVLPGPPLCHPGGLIGSNRDLLQSKIFFVACPSLPLK